MFNRKTYPLFALAVLFQTAAPAVARPPAFDASGVWNETPFNGPAEFKAALRIRE